MGHPIRLLDQHLSTLALSYRSGRRRCRRQKAGTRNSERGKRRRNAAAPIRRSTRCTWSRYWRCGTSTTSRTPRSHASCTWSPRVCPSRTGGTPKGENISIDASTMAARTPGARSALTLHADCLTGTCCRGGAVTPLSRDVCC